MKYIGVVILLFLLASWIPVLAQGKGRHADTLFQVSILDASLAGDYDGRIDFRRVKRHGNFGLGTFDALDGEIVAVDGAFYQVRADGIATQVSPDQLTPFAAVTYFRADDNFHVRGATSCSELHDLLLSRFPSDQLLYAVKVTGRFTALKTRSVPEQEKPYPPLAEVIPQQQVVFEFAAVDATLAGFWLPSVLSDVNVAGFHFHAIMTDTILEEENNHLSVNTAFARSLSDLTF